MRPIVYLWMKAPFIRVLIAVITGILLQWYAGISFTRLVIIFIASILSVSLYSFLSIKSKYQFSFLNGILINLFLISFGGLLVQTHNLRNDKAWIGNFDEEHAAIVIKLEEPLTEKANSYKALATVQCIYHKSNCKKVKGNIIVYFKKDSALFKKLGYGTRIFFSKNIQPISNSGNPGSFDFQQYCLFNGITHQVYLEPGELFIFPHDDKNFFTEFIFNCRRRIVGILQQYIPGEKEKGLAEALLIGYKEDLDKDLVQAYSNTGVVHIIAISGLHLGLIYALLLMMTKPLGSKKKWLFFRLVFVIASLWVFSILAGGGPSVLRSAVMFSFMALAQISGRRTNIYNSLAVSAFILLCINPFWLWDVGFQLSYAAVLSIIVFFRNMYAWFYFTNKLLDNIWKLNAVTIAAQLLTLPLTIYHFHQLPTLFLFTNVLAVPLSSLVLLAEILLCASFFISPLACIIGMITAKLITFMNGYIERLSGVSFAVWNGLQINIIQAFLLFLIIIGCCCWLMNRRKLYFMFSLLSLFFFMLLRSLSFIQCNKQMMIVVYNVPKHSATDLVDGRSSNFTADSFLFNNPQLQNFNLLPSRTLLRLKEIKNDILSPTQFLFHGKIIILANSKILFNSNKKEIDLLILSGNPKLYISDFGHSLCIKQIVIDSSVPQWKARLWKKDCDSLRIPCYNVSEKGAFVMNL